MKKAKLGLVALLFVVGIGGAFASKLDATRWFYFDATGQPTGPALPGSPSCAPGQLDCAQQYNVDGMNNPTTPVGNPTKGAIHQ